MASPCHASLFPTPVGTSEEHRQVTGGTVDSIHREVKQRFFLQIPEVLRIRIDVRNLVRMVRGEQYLRLQIMRGEDFAYVLVRTCLSLHSIRAMTIMDTLTYYLKSKFAIDIMAGDLTFDLPRNVLCWWPIHSLTYCSFVSCRMISTYILVSLWMEA